MTQATHAARKVVLADTRTLSFHITLRGDDIVKGHPHVLSEMADLALKLDDVTEYGVEVLAVTFDWFVHDEGVDEPEITHQLVVRTYNDLDHEALLSYKEGT